MAQHPYCDVAVIKEASHQFPGPPAPVDRLVQAHRESASLAEAAFSARAPAAIEQAERVLYALNVYSGFAPPSQPILATMWANLASARQRSLLVNGVGASTLSFRAMAAFLESAIEEADQRDHRLLEELDERGLVLYAKNWYTSTHGFEEQLISTLHRASRQVRQMLYANLGDELGADALPHAELRARTLQNFDVAYDPDDAGVLGDGSAFVDPDILTEAFAVSNVRTVFSQMPDPAYALGCFYTIEACFPSVCRRILALLRHRGITEHALYFWALHGEADEHHSAEWLHSLEAACFSDDVHARIAQGALSHLQQRHALFQALAAYANQLPSERRMFA
jgi:hypothetical protein